MSSFRADRDWEVREFKPSVAADGEARFRHEHDMLGAVSGLGLAEGDGDGTSSQGGPAPVAEVWTPERIEALEAEAFERGVASARASNAEAERVCALLEAAALELDRVAGTSITANRELMLSLAQEIAEKWVGAELRLDPSRFGEILNRVIADAPDMSGASLHLHPADRALLLSSDGEWVAAWTERHSITIEEDAAIGAGAFRIEGEHAGIDASAEAIRERLAVALREALAEENTEEHTEDSE